MADDSDLPQVVNRPGGATVGEQFRELLEARELIGFLAVRDLKSRYKQTVFGLAWAVLQPLIGAAVFLVLMTRVVGVDTDPVPYLLYVFVGFVAWTYFQASFTSASEVFTRNTDLITKVYFARLASPIAALVPGLVSVVVGLAVLVPMLLAYQRSPGWPIVTLPLWLLALFVATLGPALMASALLVRYRDLRQVVGLGLQTMLFVTPVVYDASGIEGGVRWLYYANPLAGVLAGLRWSTIAAAGPPTEAALSLGVAVVLVAVGMFVFRRFERTFADVI
ncbi:MAG: ABC transporter permease [Acidimicrobiia bacterium]|nr:ABC transporter permease [Acidimicrobiia bacterium]MDH5238082.1 ABC transporter permease [Acidimicrobiia bacterium]